MPPFRIRPRPGENGASHAATGPRLGAERDVELDGVHSADASADDTDGVPDDEDGVTFGTIQLGESMGGITIDVQNAVSGRVDAWVDFNGDGTWQPGEQILDNELVPSGMRTLNFSIPPSAVVGQTFARVRVSSIGDLEPTGPADDGEVEDHPVTILAAPPQVESVVINDGSQQRSTITSLTVTFDTLVDVPASAFTVTNLGIPSGSQNVVLTTLGVSTTDVGDRSVTTITFGPGTSVVTRDSANSLDDGNYRLDIDASLVTERASDQNMSEDYEFGAEEADDFFRLFGDANGDGTTNFGDFASSFLPAFGSGIGDPAYRDELDAGGDGVVNFADFATAFLPNFGTGR